MQRQRVNSGALVTRGEMPGIEAARLAGLRAARGLGLESLGRCSLRVGDDHAPAPFGLILNHVGRRSRNDDWIPVRRGQAQNVIDDNQCDVLVQESATQSIRNISPRHDKLLHLGANRGLAGVDFPSLHMQNSVVVVKSDDALQVTFVQRDLEVMRKSSGLVDYVGHEVAFRVSSRGLGSGETSVTLSQPLPVNSLPVTSSGGGCRLTSEFTRL